MKVLQHFGGGGGGGGGGGHEHVRFPSVVVLRAILHPPSVTASVEVFQ